METLCVYCFLEKNESFLIWMDMNGSMLFCFSEIMALFPYFLRSLRIKKMFDIREIYWRTDRMPKELILKWREFRVLSIFLSCLFAFATVYMILDRIFNVLPNYNTLGTIVEEWYPIHAIVDQIGMRTQFSID